MMIKHFLLRITIIALIFNAISASASETKLHKDFYIKLSADNHMKYSQNVATDLAFSTISGLAYISDANNLNDNILYRFGFGYGAAMVTLLNHEITGHGFRGLELGYKIKNVNVNLDLSGSTSLTPPKQYHLHKEAIVDLGGMQASHLLSQKIVNNLMEHNQSIDPITGVGYIFSAIDQFGYTYWTPSGGDGNDIDGYARDMELLYGKGAMSSKKIASVAFLDILDPVMFASLYSVVMGENIEIPRLHITDSLAITPFAKAILTPYGIIENKIGLYVFTDYTPIKIGFSYGNQSKKSEQVALTIRERGIEILNKDTGLFKGLKAGESIKNQTSYSVDFSIFKIFEIDNLKIGLDGVFWKQPELFVADAYRAKSKNGYMLMLNGTYAVNKDINIIARSGYKTKGFVPGQYIEKTAMLGLALEYKL